MKIKPSESKRKGENSTILLVGGSSLYTGAPYFTAYSALLMGFDLCYIMTADEAILSLKILLPEAIVTKIARTKWILDRINICVIGPGLGRLDDNLTKEVIEIIDFLISKNVWFIFDGDGIHFYLQNNLHKKNYENIILTPNFNEMQKILRSGIVFENLNYIEKGPSDKVNYQGQSANVNDIGTPRRCGGQGDILNGILAFLVNNNEDKLEAMKLSCKILRKAANLAFQKKNTSMIARDIICSLIKVVADVEKSNFDLENNK